MCDEWSNDFWAFVKDVGERPDNHTLRKLNQNKPIGPDNWYWKESESNADKAKYAKKWREANPEKVKNSELKKSYGIDLTQYNQMHDNQNGVCAICQNKETAVAKDGTIRLMPVDHCHVTGKIRALLCTTCNTALGGFKDDPALLRKAAEYIEKHK